MIEIGVTVNGAPWTIEAGSTVAGLVERLARGPAGIAVAVNDEVIPRSRWPGVHLQDADHVEILTAVAGG